MCLPNFRVILQQELDQLILHQGETTSSYYWKQPQLLLSGCDQQAISQQLQRKVKISNYGKRSATPSQDNHEP